MNWDRFLITGLVTLLTVQSTVSSVPITAISIWDLAGAVVWSLLCAFFVAWPGSRTIRLVAFALHFALIIVTGYTTTLCFPVATIQRAVLENGEPDERTGGKVIDGEFHFRVVSKPDRPVEGKVRFRAILDNPPADVLLEAADVPWSSVSNLNEGDEGSGRIKIRLLIEKPLFPPPIFSYPAYLFRRGLIGTGKLSDVVIEKKRGSDGSRRSFLLHLVSGYESTPELAVILASTLAEQDFLDAGTKQLFRNTGLTHVLVVSGYQVGVMFLLAFHLFRVFLLRFDKLLTVVPVDAISAGSAFLAACWYAQLTGGPLTAVRAVFGLAILAVGRALARRAHTWRSFGAVVNVSLLCWPGACFEAGCQLMFAALLGLIASDRAKEMLMRRFCLSEKIAGLLAVATLPAVMTTPIVMLWFHLFVPDAFLFNLIFAPAMSIVCTTYGGIALACVWFRIYGARLIFSSALYLTRLLLQLLSGMDGALRWVGVAPIALEGRALVTGIAVSAVAVIAAISCCFFPSFLRSSLDALRKSLPYARDAEATQ